MRRRQPAQTLQATEANAAFLDMDGVWELLAPLDDEVPSLRVHKVLWKRRDQVGGSAEAAERTSVQRPAMPLVLRR